jgi:hypothetical protein
VFILWSRVTARLFPPPIETEDDSWLFHYEEGMILLSLLLAYILYRTVSGRLIKLAETGSVQQADTDVPKAAD